MSSSQIINSIFKHVFDFICSSYHLELTKCSTWVIFLSNILYYSIYIIIYNVYICMYIYNVYSLTQLTRPSLLPWRNYHHFESAKNFCSAMCMSTTKAFPTSNMLTSYNLSQTKHKFVLLTIFEIFPYLHIFCITEIIKASNKWSFTTYFAVKRGKASSQLFTLHVF